MKFDIYGPQGPERRGIQYADGVLRDLSSFCDDLIGPVLTDLSRFFIYRHRQLATGVRLGHQRHTVIADHAAA